MASFAFFIISLFLAAAAHIIPSTVSAVSYDGRTIQSSPATSGVPFSSCDNSASFQNNTQFQENLNMVLNALSQNTPSPSHLVVKREYGTGPNKVYGFGQCLFTSLPQYNCSLCIQRAINQTSAQCPYAIGAKIIYDECLVSYGTQDTASDTTEIILVNTDNYDKDGPFNQNLDKVWNLLKRQTPYSKSPVAFVSGSDPDTVYGFAQCEDVSPSVCAARFDSGLKAVGQAIGARVFYLNSFFRYENYNFYTAGVPFQVVS